MPFQGLPWTEFISCPVCFVLFNERQQRPISLGCGHTVCKSCIKSRLTDNRCPFDQSLLPSDVDKLPANFALMHLVGAAVPEQEKEAVKTVVTDNPKSYEQARKCIEDMAVHLKPLAENASDDDSSTCSEQSPSKSNNHTAQNISGNNSNTSKCVLSRQMQRKLISLIHCQLLEEEGRSRATRIARSLGERIVSELLVLHQYPHQLSANLWAAVRTRGCQFLGPAMQEEVIKLILLALEDGSFLSRKVLVLFVVQRLESRYPQASKTAIGHVVQLLYRASCFKVLKREEESSLMQLKEEFRQYESLRREHDSQIVQIALEAGLRISPEQWSSLLYGDPAHKSHMQSIIDKHQSPQSFAQSVTELMLTLQRNSDHTGLLKLHPQLEFLSNIDPSPDCPAPSWENLEAIMRSLNTVMSAFVEFLSNPDHRSRLETTPVQNTRYKTSLCRDFTARGTCPRGNTCTFAHSQDELERYRSRSRRSGSKGTLGALEKDSSPLTPSECDQLRQVQLITKQKTEALARNGQTAGNTQPCIEQLDHQHAASSSRVFPPMFGSLPISQPPPHITGLLHPKRPPPAGACDMMQSEQEKVQFMSPAPQLTPETHLTFSCPGVDGSDNPSIPSLGSQIYFHPDAPNTYQHNPLLQYPMAHNPLIRPQPPYIPTQGMHPMLQPPFPPRSLTRPPSHQNGSLASGNTGLQASPLPLPAGEISVNMPPPSSADESLIYRGCHPFVPVPPENRPQMVPYMLQGGESLEKLTSRKQQIINHLQEEPMFMGSGASLYLANGQKGFAGLKTVLSTNKHRRQAMPKSVSDMFVATRSTQSLDELLNDDIQNYTIKWSNGDDHLSDVTANEFLETSLRGSLPESCTTNSVSFSMAATTTSGAADMAGNGRLCTSEEDGVGNLDVSTTQAVCSSDAEFCSFPSDDGDETIIPFEHTSVSRFGPISRMSKAKMYNSAPVQVTADSYKWMTPVLSVTPQDRPLATTMQMPTRFAYRGKAEMLKTEPSVKPTPLEAPSIWQQTPLPSYHNIARMKAGAAEAVTNNERLAYELQAVELEIAMKTGKEPESFTKIIQDAVVAPSEYRPSSDLTTSSNCVPPGNKDNMMNVETSQSLLVSQQLGHQFAGDCTRSWPGIKK
ncbi:unnamed protein product [Candidula unifasciata]|uniref:RING-type E3 ubiquitin transferase n=1 Tax=Candidula unifasciata TaxID=100452 RepID=A0A8S3YTP8_9EUPU|nr:unnamed protein product [Candidula unifasciata]